MNAQGTILVVDDDGRAVELLAFALEREGFQVVAARDGVEAVRLLKKHKPQLVLLELIIPRMNGWETCRRIRECSDVPIIILTTLGAEQAKVRGLDLGADDYVTKPFSLAELTARIRAALRRYRGSPPERESVRIDDRLIFDRSQHRILVDGQRLQLSPTEYRMLCCFLENAGRILTHRNLLTQVWGWEYLGETNYLKVYVHHLRQKIEKDPREPCYILTERGLGYRFQVP